MRSMTGEGGGRRALTLEMRMVGFPSSVTLRVTPSPARAGEGTNPQNNSPCALPTGGFFSGFATGAIAGAGAGGAMTAAGATGAATAGAGATTAIGSRTTMKYLPSMQPTGVAKVAPLV